MPAALPLPGDLLPLNAELTQRLDKIRWIMRAEPLVNTLINHLVDDLGEPPEILTSLGRLADATGQDVNDLRLDLSELVQSDDAKILRGQEPGRRRTPGDTPPLPPDHGLGTLPRTPDRAEPRRRRRVTPSAPCLVVRTRFHRRWSASDQRLSLP